MAPVTGNGHVLPAVVIERRQVESTAERLVGGGRPPVSGEIHVENVAVLRAPHRSRSGYTFVPLLALSRLRLGILDGGKA